MHIGRVGVLTLLLVVVAGNARSQVATEGSIRGVVRDEQGALLPGVTLTATSVDAPGTTSAITGQDGYYRLLPLAPGLYSVTAELSGFRKLTRENVLVRAGQNIPLDLVLEVGALTEIVTVRTDTPLLEVRNQAQAINITGEFQESLPLSIRRNWTDVLTLTPGTVIYDRGADSANTSAFFVHGSESGSHVIQMDGVDVRSGLSGQTRYNFIGPGSLQDTQVKLSGTDASAPLGTGAVINMVTRSGTNQFRGTASFTGQSRKWTDDNIPGGISGKLDLVEPEVTAGGPLRVDRLWYFGSYRYTSATRVVARTPVQVQQVKSVFPDVVFPETELVSHQPLAKVTVKISPTQTIEGFLQHGRDRTRGGAANALQFTNIGLSGGTAAAVQWKATRGSALAMRAAITYSDSTAENDSAVDEPRREIYRTVSLSSGQLTGQTLLAIFDSAVSDLQEAPADKGVVTLDATYYRTGLAGSHELQFGTYLQPKRRRAFYSIPAASDGFNLEQFVLRNPSDPGQGWVPFSRRIVDTSTDTLTSDGRLTDYGVYVQDAWKPTGQLTIHGGLRVDFLKIRDALSDVRVQDTTAVGPRFGMTYVLTRDARNVVRGTWTRIHDSLGEAGTPALTGRIAGQRDLFDLNLDGTFETEFVTPAMTTDPPARVIDIEGFRQPRVDEWTIGYQRQLPGQLALDLGLVHRTFRDRTARVEVNGIYDGEVFRGYQDERFSELFRTTSNIWNWPVYTGLSFTVTKRTSRIQAIASYTRQWRHISGIWQPNDPASFIQPDAFPNNHNIGAVTTSGTNSLSGTDMANGFSQWRDHAIAAGVAYDGPWQLELATSLNVQSGAWSGPIVESLAQPDPRFGPPTVRLSTGRIVPNPLATTTRFHYPTRGEGQFTGEWTPEWNVRIGRSFRRGGITIRPAVDVLNIVNTGRSSAPAVGANQLYNMGFGTLRATVIPPRVVQVSLRTEF